MELEALKASWNKLDERVKEVIQQKTKSAYDRIVGQNIYNFVVNMLIICVVFPYVYMKTPIQATSFAIVEGVMVIGLIPLVWKLSLLSKFDLGGKSSSELSRLPSGEGLDDWCRMPGVDSFLHPRVGIQHESRLRV